MEMNPGEAQYRLQDYMEYFENYGDIYEAQQHLREQIAFHACPFFWSPLVHIYFVREWEYNNIMKLHFIKKMNNIGARYCAWFFFLFPAVVEWISTRVVGGQIFLPLDGDIRLLRLLFD